jgi:hypothetical protein
MQGKPESCNKPFKRKAIGQHKDLLLDPQYRHKQEAHRRVRLSVLEEEDFKREVKEYLNENC